MILSRFIKCEQQSIFEFVKKHAILFTFILCVFFSTFSFMRQESLDPGNLFIAFAIMCVCSFFVSFYIHKKFAINSIICTVICLILCALSLWYLKGLFSSKIRAVYIFISLFALIFLLYVYLVFTKKATLENTIAILFLLGFLIRLTYVLSTSMYERQHDFYGFYGEEVLYDTNADGHGGYISYLFYNNFKLPNFDPTLRDQFYHPPLHYFICALWWKIQTLVGISNNYAQENIQTLTLFYSCVCMILTYKTLKILNVEGVAQILAFSIIAFHPTFIIFSASLNNDILSVTFMLASFYCALRWYKSQKLKDILLCGLFVGLGMLSKLSAYMICIPIAVIFLAKFFADSKLYGETCIKKYVINFGLFFVVCAPIALFWSFRNLINYDVPLAFVQKLPEDSFQYLGNYSTLERLFLIAPKENLGNLSIYEQWISSGDRLYNEINPMVSLLKTSMFGEFINGYYIPAINGFSHALFFSNLVIAFSGVVSLVIMIINAIKYKEIVLFRFTLAVFFASMLIFYYIFCFTYPHHCTMNIRYVSPLIFVGAITIGIVVNDLKYVKNIKLKNAIETSGGILVGIFALSSVLTYLLIASSI